MQAHIGLVEPDAYRHSTPASIHRGAHTGGLSPRISLARRQQNTRTTSLAQAKPCSHPMLLPVHAPALHAHAHPLSHAQHTPRSSAALPPFRHLQRSLPYVPADASIRLSMLPPVQMHTCCVRACASRPSSGHSGASQLAPPCLSSRARTNLSCALHRDDAFMSTTCGKGRACDVSHGFAFLGARGADYLVTDPFGEAPDPSRPLGPPKWGRGTATMRP